MKIDKPKTRSVTPKKSKYDWYRREHRHRREKHKIIRFKAMIKNLSLENKMRIQMEKRIEELNKIVRRH